MHMEHLHKEQSCAGGLRAKLESLESLEATLGRREHGHNHTVLKRLREAITSSTI